MSAERSVTIPGVRRNWLAVHDVDQIVGIHWLITPESGVNFALTPQIKGAFSLEVFAAVESLARFNFSHKQSEAWYKNRRKVAPIPVKVVRREKTELQHSEKFVKEERTSIMRQARMIKGKQPISRRSLLCVLS